MGTTPNGLPYPEDTGPVRQGAADIRALAEGIRIAQGFATFPTGQGTRSVTVAFPPGLFTEAPQVVASPTGSFVTASVPTGQVNVNGCMIQGLYRTANGVAGTMPGGVYVRWIAVQLA